MKIYSHISGWKRIEGWRHLIFTISIAVLYNFLPHNFIIQCHDSFVDDSLFIFAKNFHALESFTRQRWPNSMVNSRRSVFVPRFSALLVLADSADKWKWMRERRGGKRKSFVHVARKCGGGGAPKFLGFASSSSVTTISLSLSRALSFVFLIRRYHFFFASCETHI